MSPNGCPQVQGQPLENFFSGLLGGKTGPFIKFMDYIQPCPFQIPFALVVPVLPPVDGFTSLSVRSTITIITLFAIPVKQNRGAAVTTLPEICRPPRQRLRSSGCSGGVEGVSVMVGELLPATRNFECNIWRIISSLLLISTRRWVPFAKRVSPKKSESCESKSPSP